MNVHTNSGAIPSNLSSISTNLVGGIQPSCKIKNLRVYNEALTDAELQALTS